MLKLKLFSSSSFNSRAALKQSFLSLHTMSINVPIDSFKEVLASRSVYGRFFSPFKSQVRGIYGNCRIGNRDVVGYGINGSYNYKDDAHFPFPAVRFMENSRDIIALREKEKGDWKMLCCEEKKALYRASFCQTFAEFQHPTGLWKLIFGWVMFLVSFTLWVHIFFHYYVWDEPLPESLSPAGQRAQLRRMIEIRVNPIDGLASKWDYDNDCWKSQKPPTPSERMEHQGI